MKNANPSIAKGSPIAGAVVLHQTGPQQAHLEGQDGARYRPDREQDTHARAHRRASRLYAGSWVR